MVKFIAGLLRLSASPQIILWQMPRHEPIIFDPRYGVISLAAKYSVPLLPPDHPFHADEAAA